MTVVLPRIGKRPQPELREARAKLACADRGVVTPCAYVAITEA